MPVRDEGWEFDQLTYLTMLMSGLVVLLRITQQAVTKTGFHAEDILLIAAYLLAIPEAAININYRKAASQRTRELWANQHLKLLRTDSGGTSGL